MVATSTVPAVRFVRVLHAGTERRFVLLDAPTRERYVELVARCAGAIEELLSPSVMANRVASWSVRPPELVLRPWRLERRLFATHLSEHDVEELQLEAASLAVAFGVTTIHEMSMPAERGMRDLEILLDARDLGSTTTVSGGP